MHNHVNVIIFDVDNTLIRGNLTFFFLKHLVKEKFYFFRTCFTLLLQGALLVFRQLPHITSTILLNGGSVLELDVRICQTVKSFYQKLFETLKTLDLLGHKLQRKANHFFTKDFFEKTLYEQGFEKIKHHLGHKNTIIVLLSGSVQELLEPFFQKLCERLDSDRVAWQKRFFIQGTRLGENNEVQACIGSEKNRLLKKLLRREGYDNYTLQFIYSDNNFMADLPLLIEARHGGALISEKNNLYQKLPKKLLDSLIFLPEWQKKFT